MRGLGRKESHKNLLNYVFSLVRTIFFIILAFMGVISNAHAETVLTLDYQAKAGTPTSILSGQFWTMQLNYAVSSTTGSASGVKIIIPLPDEIHEATSFTGTSHAPSNNFVFDGTPGSKKLSITFVEPLPSGSTGVLEFALRSQNGTIPNGTVIQTCATMTDSSGQTSGAKCNSMTMTAQTNFCGAKTLLSGGALDNQTTYRISVGYQQSYFSNPPAGSLNITDVSLTDTFPAGAEFVSAKVFNRWDAEVASNITPGSNNVTVTIPDYIIPHDWLEYGGSAYYVDVTLKYNSTSFSSGQSVTNTAAIKFTPFSGTPTTVTDGQLSGCTNDLAETHPLSSPNPVGNLVKVADSSSSIIHPDEIAKYRIQFNNTGNIPLENVEIIETIPTDQVNISDSGTYNSHIFFHGGTTYISGTEYQTNLNSNWTNWPLNGARLYNPANLANGEYVTKYKIKLVPSFPSNASTGIIMLAFSGKNTATTQTINNCVEWNSTTPGISSNRTACHNNFTLEPTPSTASVYYNIAHSPRCSGNFSLNQILDFYAHVRANIGYSALENPTVAMFLPEGFEYEAGSESIELLNSSLPTPTLTVTPKFGGGERTLFRWTFPNGTVLPPGKEFKVHVNTRLGANLIGGQNYMDDTWVMVEGSNIGVLAPENIYALGVVDQYDWDGDGNTTETFRPTPTSQSSCGLIVSSSASMESIKWVKGLLDTQYSKYPDYGQTVPGGNADYKLVVTNSGNVTMKDIKIIDILPYVGDKGVIDTSARETAWTPNLAAPITAPVGVTVYYSTSGNPCRDEVKQPAATSPFPTGCEAPNWTTTPPINITSVKSVKIDFGTSTLAGGQSLEFTWPMRAPIDAPTNNEIAWNSFAFTATRSDNDQPLLAAEPNKVGIQVKGSAPAYYGNRVWYDNDHDGIQDMEEGGVDGVKVNLFKVPTLNTTPNPDTDNLINFTITGNGGYYRFSNLSAGFYYAMFEPPTGYNISPKNTGTTATDSDGAPITYQGNPVMVTGVTELTVTEDDDTWDQGIYCNFNPTITSNSPVQPGDTLTMSINPATGSYTWTGPNGWTATGANVSRPNMTVADAGLYTVNATANPDGSGCWAGLNANVSVGTAKTDLKLTKTASKSTARHGDTLTYTITLSNESDVAATGVQVEDKLPTGLTFVKATPSQGSFANGVWTVGTVAAHATLIMTLEVTVD